MGNKSSSSFKKNIVFIKLFLGILGISSLAVIILSVSIFYWFRGKTMEDIDTADKMVLSNIDTLMSNYLDSAKRISVELYQSPYIKRIIYSNSGEWDDDMKIAANSTLSSMSANSFVNSIYVFGDSGVLLKASNSIIPVEYEDFISNIMKKSRQSQPVPWNLERKSGQNYKFISIFLGEGALDSSRLDNAVLVNIDMNIVHDHLFPQSLGENQDILIISKTGKVLLHNDMKQFALDMVDNPFARKIFESALNKGNFTSIISSKKYSISYINSASNNYYIVRIIPYNLSIQKLTSARNITIMISTFIFLLVLCASFFLSYKIYKPINTIFSNIKNLFSDTSQNTSNMNEIQLVSNATFKIIERMNNYDKEMENSAVKDLFDISRNSIGNDELIDILRKMKVNTDVISCYCILILRISNIEEFNRQNTKQAIDFQVSSIGHMVSEYLNNITQCNSYAINNEHAVLIVKESPTGIKLGDINIKRLMEDASDSILRIFGLEISIGISGIASEIREIRDKYFEAFELTKYRLIYGKRAVIDSSMIKNEEKSEELAYYMHTLVEATKKCSSAEFEEALYKLFCICSFLKYEAIAKILSQVALSIMKIPDNTGFESNRTSVLDYPEIYKKIEEVEDFSELKNCFMTLFYETSHIIQGLDSTNIRDITSKSLEYIAENYHNQDITANLLAEKLSITPSYFSKIFKECTGTTFPDYINNIRLEKARELLISDHKLEVIEICSRVGYNNASYFSAAFRKKYSITPSKYRLNHLVQ